MVVGEHYGWRMLRRLGGIFCVGRCGGFSALEGAAVLGCVGALAAFIMGGASMANRTKLGTVISDINSYSKEIIEFENKYGGLPGDTATISLLPGVVAGNANGVIDAGEALQVWRHLSVAGIIEGNFDGTSTNIPGRGVPQGPFGSNSGYNIISSALVDESLGQAVVVELAGFSPTSNSLGILSPEDAKSIDKKMDDGNPNTGIVRGVDGAGDNSTTECVSGGMLATATYNTSSSTSKTLGCRLRVITRTSSQADDSAETSGCLAGQSRISPNPLDVCPLGTFGHIIQTCRFDDDNVGTWVISENNCQPVTCQGGMKMGETRILPCGPGFTGSATPAGMIQECSADGVWKNKTNNCTPDLSACVGNGVADGDIRQPLACNWGYMGQVSEICSAPNWALTGSGNSCVAIACSGGVIGDIRASATACPAGYDGGHKESCLADGIWAITSNTCAPQTPVSACTVGTTADQNLGCPIGETGVNLYRCSGVEGEAGVWAPLQNTCAPITCSGERIGSTRIINDAKCPGGASGFMIEICKSDGASPPKGRWTKPADAAQLQCAAALCDGKDRSGNAVWPYTAKGTSNQAGTCMPGYTNNPTAPTRNCDSDGVWGAVTNPCTRTLCPSPDDNANWVSPYSKTADVKGRCIWPDYEGSPTRDCDLNPTAGASVATWSSAAKSPCKPSALPVKNSLSLWLDAADITSLYTDTTCTTQAREGQGIRCWMDKSGSATPLNVTTSGGAPVYTTNAQNSKPALAFNNTALTRNSVTAAQLANNNEATIFFAMKYSSPAHLSSPIQWQDGTGRRINIHYIWGGSLVFWDFGGPCCSGGNRINAGYTTMDTWNILTARRRVNNTGEVYINSSLLVSGSGMTDANIAGNSATLVIGNDGMVGHLAEMIIYKTGLIESDRLDVESYLSQKWGIPIVPPNTGIVLWLDGADTSSVYSNSNCSTGQNPGNNAAIGCWRDKAGGNHATASSGVEPLYNMGSLNNLSVLKFDGSNDGMVINNLNLGAPYTVFIVNRYYGANRGRTLQSRGVNWLAGLWNGNYSYYGGDSYGFVGNAAATTGTWYIVTARNTGSYASAYVNNVTFTGCQGCVASPGTLGLISGGLYNEQSHAEIAEIIIYNSALGISNRYAVDSYLSTKWGIPIPKPPVTAGMVVWLDADDRGVVFSAGFDGFAADSAAVAGWGDKSRNGYGVSAGNAPTYVLGGMNSRPVISFNGSNVLTQSSFLDLDRTTMMAVAGYSGTDTSQGIAEISVGGSVNTGALLFYEGASKLRTITSGTAYNAVFSEGLSLKHIVTGIADGLNTSLYIDGELKQNVSSGILNGNINRLDVGMLANLPSYALTGTIAEVNIYNRALSATEQCSMNSYLGGKWGLSVAPCPIGTPAAVTAGLALWLDAADGSTIFTSTNCTTGQNPISGAALGCWRDKSGNFNSATQTTAGSRPVYTTSIINSKPVIRFNGSNFLNLTTPSTLGIQNSAYEMFVVARSSYTSAPAFLIAGAFEKYEMHLNSPGLRFIPDNGPYVDIGSSTAYTTGGAAHVFAARVMDNEVSYVRVDGVDGSAPGSSAKSADNTALVIGRRPGGAYPLTGDIAEIMIYKRALSNAERILVEKALGAKWNIVVNPIVGTSLWLDGADSATLYTNTACTTPVAANGNGVACWADKSGNGLNVTQSTGGNQPIYTTGAQNGMSALAFNGSGQMLARASVPYSSISASNANTIFLVQKNNVTKNASTLFWAANDSDPRINIHALEGDGILRFDFGTCCPTPGSRLPAYVTNFNSVFKVITARRQSNNTAQIYVNGEMVASSAGFSNTISGTGTLTIGNLALALGNPYYFNGQIGELVMYNSGLSEIDRKNIEIYLGNKWGVPVVSPNTPSGLKLWWDAADRSSLYTSNNCSSGQYPGNGNTIGCWKDKASGYNATQGNAGLAPVYATGALNSNPVLQFGGSRWLAYPDVGEDSQTTVFTVHIEHSLSGFVHIMGRDAWGTKAVHYLFNNTTLGLSVSGRNPTDAYNSNYTTGTYRLTTITDNNSLLVNYANGIQQATYTITGPQNKLWGPGTIGAWSGSSRYLNGNIAEIIIYNTALSDVDRVAVQQYLGTKWSIVVP